MKVRILLCVLVSMVAMHQSFVHAEDRDDTTPLLVMFWNLENFFDYVDSGAGDSDTEFSPQGQRRWTRSRFYTKCNAVSKAILWIADNRGRIPDVICMAEVENLFVVKSIARSPVLRKYGYAAVHYDSPDHRGIDVALMYRKEIFEELSSRPCRIYDRDSILLHTRDILCVSLKDRRNGVCTSFLVNHHPSKFGGAEASEGRRRIAMETLKSVCDSIFCEEGPEAGIVATGDFNDTPSGGLLGVLCGEGSAAGGPCMAGRMVNLGDTVEESGQGTIRYKGKWELIDMFVVSETMSEEGVMEVVKVPFLMARDNTHVGEKPFRTYSGPRYIGGVSDHCPIIFECKDMSANSH